MIEETEEIEMIEEIETIEETKIVEMIEGKDRERRERDVDIYFVEETIEMNAREIEMIDEILRLLQREDIKVDFIKFILYICTDIESRLF